MNQPFHVATAAIHSMSGVTAAVAFLRYPTDPLSGDEIAAEAGSVFCDAVGPTVTAKTITRAELRAGLRAVCKVWLKYLEAEDGDI